MISQPKVALVGIGVRLPGGVKNPTEFTRFLRAHGDGVRDVPEDRWSSELYYHPDPRVPGKAYVKRGGFLTQDIFAFDPEPFGISPREADRLDPQQRLLLEATWDALEDAGMRVDALRGSNTAVFIGGFTQDHQTLAFARENRDLIDAHTSVGASMTVLSNRLSYTFDWRGPSVTVDTACSSSLVAAALGYEAIVHGGSTLAVVGGVNVMLSPTTTIAMCKGHFLAADGRSKTFEANADGYGRGEGVGVVVLKPLELAERDGDRIYAVVSAIGVNQDGRTQGMPLPNEDAQRELCRSVLAKSGLLPGAIRYVEAHGTGTRVGDPIETRALGSVYGVERDAPLLIGSVKTNIGHLEAAAGVTGLIKAALSVYHGEVFPVRALASPNPEIPFAELGLEIAKETRPLPADGANHVAVNAFGYGGTNAHAILGEWHSRARVNAEPDASAERDALRLVPISAACPEALRERARELSACIDVDNWQNQAFTLARRRAHLSERAVVLASSAADLKTELAELAEQGASASRLLGRAASERRLLWVFTGMGPQWWGMGQELYRAERAFRDVVDAADAAFVKAAGWSILEQMLADESASRMRSNSIAQPANFILQAGLVGLLRSLGVPAHGYLGHSVGEVTAAWAAGCLSLDDAAYLAFHRSRIQQLAAGKGSMLAVGLSLAEVSELSAGIDDVTIAAYNSTRSFTLSGARSALERVAERLSLRGAFHRFVPVEVAYHSPHMDALEWEFKSALARVTPSRPAAALYSTAHGNRVQAAVHDAEYWWENARKPVLLAQALETAIADGFSAFLEVGPHPVLGAAVRDACEATRCDGKTFFCLKRNEPERASVLRATAQLFTSGVSLDWASQYPEGELAPLPQYPFQRKTHWVESSASAAARVGRAAPSAFFSERDPGPTLRFVADLGRPAFAYLSDHRIQGVTVFPAAGYVEAALQASVELEPKASQHVLEDLRFERALALHDARPTSLMLDMDAESGSFGIHARSEKSWERHAAGFRKSWIHYAEPEKVDLAAIAARLIDEVDVSALYARFHELGLEYGANFRGLTSVRVARDEGGGSVLARLAPAEFERGLTCVDPTLLDAAFQALLALFTDAEQAIVPVAIGCVRWSSTSQAPAWVSGRAALCDDGSLRGALTLIDAAGSVVLELSDLVCRPLEQRSSRVDASASWLHTEAWLKVEPRGERVKSGETWLLVGDARALLGRLAEALRDQGIDARLAQRAQPALFSGVDRVVFACEPVPSARAGASNVDALLELVQALGERRPLLDVITFRAQRVRGDERVEPNESALWGFTRVLMTEHPEYAARLVDLDADSELGALLGWLGERELDEEGALRNGVFYARRLQRRSQAVLDETRGDVEAASGPRATAEFGALRLPRRLCAEPRAEEVEVELLSVAIERSELAERLEEGDRDCFARPFTRTAPSVLGRVVRVGAEVSKVRVSELVLFHSNAALASHQLLDAERVLPVLDSHTHAQCMRYFDYLRAWHALRDVAGLARGARILVLSADCDLGRACVEVARVLGLEARVTLNDLAHEPEFRALGVASAHSAATLDFVETLRADTGNQGVDAVFAVPGAEMASGAIRALKSHGRFISLAAFEHPERIDLRLLQGGVSLMSIDFERFTRDYPAAYRAIARQVLELFARGELEPSGSPTLRVVARDESMFGALADDGAQTLLFDVESADALEPLVSDMPFRSDRSYLVSGGLAGFGLATAKWLVERGARSVVLGSRRGEPEGEAAPEVRALRARGARVECRSLDVADAASVDATLEFIARELPPLAGVFHSAMVLEDGPIAGLTRESLARVMRPKARGAYLLHEKTRALPLAHFVLYSSVSAWIGNPNQAAYAAANAFLDGLAALRQSEGLPALSVSFGAIADAGVVARNGATKLHLKALGIAPIPAERALNLLEGELNGAAAQLGILDMQWDRWAESFALTPWKRLSELRVEGAVDAAKTSVRDELANLAAEARAAQVFERTRTAIAGVLRIGVERLDASASLPALGLDSLMSLELQAALERATGISLPSIELLAGASLNELSARILERFEPKPSLPALEPAASDLREQFLARICVSAPYFDLFDFKRAGDWVEAWANPLPVSEYELDAVSCAEGARHLAIVGSCAVSSLNPTPGKTYYPVLKAQHIEVPAAAPAQRAPRFESAARVRVRARCTEFDARASRATAETELLTADGTLLRRLSVEYHVIPELQFKALFAANARETAQASASNPYAQHSVLPPVDERDGVFSIALGVVEPEDCLGHFHGYPALPVSIMTRYAVDLIASAVRLREGRGDLRVSVVAGRAETRAFAFAGASVSLHARSLGRDVLRAEELFTCEVRSAERAVASFELRVQIQKPRHSGIQVRVAEESTARRASRVAG